MHSSFSGGDYAGEYFFLRVKHKASRLNFGNFPLNSVVRSLFKVNKNQYKKCGAFSSSQTPIIK